MAVLENAKQETFAQNLAKGMSQRQAYLAAFPSAKNWKPETVDNKAYKLANSDEILARCNELKEASACNAILDRQERMIILSNFALNEELFPKARMQAIDLLNKMDGDYVQKISAVVSAPVSETVAKVAEILGEVDE